MKSAVYSLLIIFIVITCNDKKDNPTPVSYQVMEDFENARKDAYTAGELRLHTGIWELDDALIWGGAVQGDASNGERSLRIRNTGRVTTTFEINNVTMVYLKHALFGKDAPAHWKIQIASRGLDFKDLTKEITTSTYSLKLDSFAVSDTGKVRLRIVKLGGGRLNIDDVVFKGNGESGIVFSDPGTPESIPEPQPASPRNAVRGDDAPPASGDNSNLLLGNPSNATTDVINYSNYLIDHHYFVLSYNRDRGTPNWVSWHLDETHITAAVGRQDNFAPYLGIPESWYRVSDISYAGSGFDRGHNCPSGDRTSSRTANAATFLMTNMIPQAPQHNGGPWADLEGHIRDLVRGGREAYITMGSYGRGGIGSKGRFETIDEGKIVVPERIWKVVLLLPRGENDLTRIDRNADIIAVDMPNTNDINPSWKNYRVSVDYIEQQTGYDLFANLPEKTQEILEESIVVHF